MTDKKKSLLYIVPKINFFSEGHRGRVMHALGIAEGFIENGWDVVIVGGPGLHGFKEDLPAEVELIEIENKEGVLRKLRWSISLMFKYMDILSDKTFDVFIVRYVLLKYLFMWIFCYMAKARKQITVLEVNSFAFHVFKKMPDWFELTVAKIEVKMVNKFDILYTVSESMASDPKINGCSTNIVPIPNGASSKVIQFSDRNTSENKQVRFIYLGSLQEYWDFDIVLMAFLKYLKKNDNVEFHFYGTGPMEGYLKNKAANEPRIVFHGRFKRSDLGCLLNKKTDILILPPIRQSDMARSGGLSTKLFDYLSLRMPIIAPAMGEINNVLKHKENALLYQHDSAGSIIEKIELLLSQPELRNQIAQNAYIEFKEKHTWGVKMSMLIEKINEIRL